MRHRAPRAGGRLRLPWPIAAVAVVLVMGVSFASAATGPSKSITCSETSTQVICPRDQVTSTVTVTASAPLTSSTPTPTPSQSTATTTPTSSQPSTGPLTDCLIVPSRCGYPDSTNTGVQDGVSLRVVNGDFRTSSDGQVVAGLDIKGTLYIDNSNVTAYNDRVTEQGSNGWAVTIGAQATASHQLTGITLSYLTIDGGRSHGGGVQAPEGNVSWTLDHSDVSNGENGIRSAGNATIRDCYVHDLAAGSGAHFDDVEIYAGTGDVYDHNTLTLGVGTGFTSAWNVQGDFAAVISPTLSNSLLDGGGYTVNVRGIGAHPVTGAVLSGNRFGKDHAYGYSADDATGTTASGNVADATGKNIDSQL
jgi:hypothetical protein